MTTKLNILKVLLFNIAILLLLIFLIEIIARISWTAKSCIYDQCDLARISSLKVRDTVPSRIVGISKLDSKLGYIPNPFFEGSINGVGWKNKKVSIDKNSFRTNDNSEIYEPSILAVGDSFTFGDQVSNNETWPSCLERKLNRGVINAGVFGYGTAQSLKRAEIVVDEYKINTVILSAYVTDGFKRDQLEYRSGFVKPSLIIDINNDNKIKWSTVSDPNKSGTKYNPNKNFSLILLKKLYENIFIFNIAMDLIFPGFDFTGDQLTIKHANAAEIIDIIEFTFKNFENFTGKKILLLQYGSDLKDKAIIDNRKMIKNIISKYQINLIDSYDVFNAYDPKTIWSGHHTKLGNDIICNVLAEELKK